MDRLDPKAVARVAGRAWDDMRPTFEQVHGAMIGPSPTATGTLTTIYIKYTADDTAGKPFGVVWVKNSNQIVVGLALPEGDRPGLESKLVGHSYAGLTSFLVLARGQPVPAELAEWARQAHEHARSGL